MKLKIKKIIAREFILTLCCLTIAFLGFLGTIMYNYSIDSDLEKLQKEIYAEYKLLISLRLPIKDKIVNQENFYKEIEKRELQGKNNSSIKYWARLSKLNKDDSIVYRWNKLWTDPLVTALKEMGFKDGHEFNEFVSKYSFKENEESIKLKLLETQNKIDALQEEKTDISEKRLNNENTFLGLLLFIGMLFFPIRYLIYSITWSIQTLRQNESFDKKGN